MTDPAEILRAVLAGYADSDKWTNAPFERMKRISNTLVGAVGQEFVERICAESGFACEFPLDAKGNRSKIAPWDIRIRGIEFELKTATEDVSGSFQFNHIRYHRAYDALLCVGVAPAAIHFGVWSKAEVATGKAGNLVAMEKGTNASHKLTKRPENLRPITQFPRAMDAFIKDFPK